MPSLAVARAANAAFSPAYFPIAVFVGGTSGIGKALAEAFAKYTHGNAHIVLVGRNRVAAEAILAGLPHASAPAAVHEFVPCDVSLMRNVHRTTATLLSRLPKINFLFLSAGFLRFQGRVETAEGIDERLALHYYSRWKFVDDLLPLLRKAEAAGEHAKVMSVLGAGHGGPIDLQDLGLKNAYTFSKAASASPTYTDLMIEASGSFAERDPRLSFVHVWPGYVRTPILSGMHWTFALCKPVLDIATRPFTISEDACAEYLLYAMFNAASGATRVDEKGDGIGMERYCGSAAARELVWEHTREEMERALSSTSE